MDPLNDLLLQTFDDQQLSRGEKQLLNQVLADARPDDQKLGVYRAQAFAIARSALQGPDATRVLAWLEEVVKVLQRPRAPEQASVVAEACFAPGNDCPGRINQLFNGAKQKVDICVFTITDDRVTSAILKAHQRRVAMRIITDNEKLLEPGSDVGRLHQAGIPVRVDRDANHMHHKFALFDGGLLLTGSYNWTRGAAERNMENFIISSDPRLLSAFARTFEQLWQTLPRFP